MTLRFSRTSTAALLALALLSACDRQPVGTTDPAAQPASGPALSGLPMNPPGRENAGFVSFTYSGDETGRYFAFGAPDSVVGTSPMGADFAAATHYYLGIPTRQEFGTAITSTARAQAGLSDGIHIQFRGALQPGTYDITTCGRGSGPFCPLINIVFDADNSVDGGGTQTRYYSFSSGTITVQSVEDERVRGTFSGTAVSTDWSTGETSTIVITDGRFDVPVTERDLAGG
jgi:hypothetical protein